MNTDDWVIIDTETTGLTQPIFVVEIAAQKMKGLKRYGEPFRRLINQNADIPPNASRVHGYTKEILTRDGESPEIVYKDFSQYVGDRPIVAYNLKYDWDEVLIPEWERLGIKPIGNRGFCAYHLTQRLLDPSPAGNFKLQSLRQYFRLPERGAHTALGDVETVIDLFEVALAQRLEEEDVISFTEKDWFPSNIPFGKFKGVDFRGALEDQELRNWIEWLAKSVNKRSAKFGQWYLHELERHSNLEALAKPPFTKQLKSKHEGPERKQILNKSVDQARTKLSELSSKIMTEKNEVEFTQAQLFQLTGEYYRKRDRLAITIKYRKQFLDILLIEGEDEAEQAVNEFKEESDATDKEYAKASSSSKNKKTLSDEEEKDLQKIWKKLARVYHPDQIVSEPDKQETYQNLTATINNAKEEQNIAILQEISEDPNLFAMKRGWKPIDPDIDEVLNLEKLLASLKREIIHKNDELVQLRKSPEYEIMVFCRGRTDRIAEVANKQVQALEAEILNFQVEADALGEEIVELTNNSLKIL